VGARIPTRMITTRSFSSAAAGPRVDHADFREAVKERPPSPAFCFLGPPRCGRRAPGRVRPPSCIDGPAGSVRRATVFVLRFPPLTICGQRS
jgi:hypothetical protein